MGEVCYGFVIGNLAGLCCTIRYLDDCVRPGPKDWLPGTMVSSTKEIVSGLCEHFDAAVIEDVRPQTKPTGAPVVDTPVDAATIEKAKIPPKLPAPKSTAPVKTVPQNPVEVGDFEYNLTAEERRELQEAMRSNSSDVGGGEKPTSVFDGGLAVETKASRPGKPVSAFNMDPRSGPIRKW